MWGSVGLCGALWHSVGLCGALWGSVQGVVRFDYNKRIKNQITHKTIKHKWYRDDIWYPARQTQHVRSLDHLLWKRSRDDIFTTLALWRCLHAAAHTATPTVDLLGYCNCQDSTFHCVIDLCRGVGLVIRIVIIRITLVFIDKWFFLSGRMVFGGRGSTISRWYSWKVFGETSTIKLKRRMLNGWPLTGRAHRLRQWVARWTLLLK